MPKTLLSKSTLLGAGLLLSTAALGVALAAGPEHRRHHEHESAAVSEGREGGVRVAREHGAGRHEDHHRRHAEDDDDEGDEGGQGGAGQARPSGPDVPVPQNGLFNGQAKPKVDVQ
jgi:hypothetical protein